VQTGRQADRRRCEPGLGLWTPCERKRELFNCSKFLSTTVIICRHYSLIVDQIADVSVIFIISVLSQRCWIQNFERICDELTKLE
jgi:hypothetical protein